ncbi:MAG TPA: molybdate ABC transporter substrate-binding protein [Desulfuromonadales bacterium]|jgi:molybdate transport system substrate-binding protein
MMRKAGLLLLLFVCAVSAAAAGEIRLSVAASLTDAINEICADYAKTHPGTTCVGNFGGSGTLAKQIAAGAPADIFISANPKWVDFLVGERRVAADTVSVLAGNALVFVGPKERASAMADLPGLKRIAIGSPKSVPAGQYAEEAMKKAGVYDLLVKEGRLVMAQDVRQALIYAERGETDGAFVYRTDALLAREIVILFEVPKEYYSPITYPMALTDAGRANSEAVSFFAFLQSQQARAILSRYGFAMK